MWPTSEPIEFKRGIAAADREERTDEIERSRRGLRPCRRERAGNRRPQSQVAVWPARRQSNFPTTFLCNSWRTARRPRSPRVWTSCSSPSHPASRNTIRPARTERFSSAWNNSRWTTAGRHRCGSRKRRPRSGSAARPREQPRGNRQEKQPERKRAGPPRGNGTRATSGAVGPSDALRDKVCVRGILWTANPNQVAGVRIPRPAASATITAIVVSA